MNINTVKNKTKKIVASLMLLGALSNTNMIKEEVLAKPISSVGNEAMPIQNNSYDTITKKINNLTKEEQILTLHDFIFKDKKIGLYNYELLNNETKINFLDNLRELHASLVNEQGYENGQNTANGYLYIKYKGKENVVQTPSHDARRFIAQGYNDEGLRITDIENPFDDEYFLTSKNGQSIYTFDTDKIENIMKNKNIKSGPYTVGTDGIIIAQTKDETKILNGFRQLERYVKDKEDENVTFETFGSNEYSNVLNAEQSAVETELVHQEEQEVLAQRYNEEPNKNIGKINFCSDYNYEDGSFLITYSGKYYSIPRDEYSWSNYDSKNSSMTDYIYISIVAQNLNGEHFLEGIKLSVNRYDFEKVTGINTNVKSKTLK
ncbi:MAG: hypothetical protein ACK5HL_03535 [Bacilli bacterium]